VHTTHIAASPGEIADAVLLPGDPLRGARIADAVLTEHRCHNSVRNMLGFTGMWHGRRLSVQATGIGAPSMAIYATELFTQHGVRTAVRVGTCGALQGELALGDLVIAISAGSDSRLGERLPDGMRFSPTAPFALVRTAVESATRHGWPVHAGAIMSSDTFYGIDMESIAAIAEAGALALDMETAALYDIAARHQVGALSVLIVTDQLGSGDAVPATEREAMFERTTTVALDVLRVCHPGWGG
jgi:purine-nucleoside phosphorylase